MNDLIKEKRSVGSFSKIRIRSFAHVEIVQSDEESVVIEALPSSQNLIKAEVVRDILLLSYKWQAYLWPRRFNAYLKVKNLEGIYFEGAGDVKTELINADKIQINISGSGKVDAKFNLKDLDVSIAGSGSLLLSGTSEKENIRIAGSGSFNAENLKASECSVNISGSGSVKVNVEKKLDIFISGSGSVAYSGNPQVNQQIMGSGRVYQNQ
jgi:hypothetical protein